MSRTSHMLKGLLAIFLLVVLSSAASAETFYVEGEGGVPLAVTVTGPEDGPEILFLHGIGMGAESFSPQLESDLAQHFRMVAFDLRGHGMSGKPSDEAAYTDRAIWAGDVRRVMAATGLKRPVIVAWSYGTLVTADYLRVEGTDHVAGLIMIGALGGFTPFVPPTSGPEAKVLADLTLSRELRQRPSLVDQEKAVDLILPMLVGSDAVPGWLAHARTLGLLVPAYAQGPLRKHPSDNTDLVPKLQGLAICAMRGELDAAVPVESLDAFMKAFPQARQMTFVGASHSLFAEQPAAFNAALAKFVGENWRPSE